MLLRRIAAGSLAFGLLTQAALADQQTVNAGTAPNAGDGDTLRVSFTKLNANDAELYARIATLQQRLAQLGNVATLNIGTTPGTVADGGALMAEIYRAQAAEQTNATALAGKAPLASPAFTGAPTVPTPAFGDTSNQIANMAAVSAAIAASPGAPASRQITGAGLATGGGNLTADRTITVPKASASDVAVGTDDTKALTSLSVAPALRYIPSVDANGVLSVANGPTLGTYQNGQFTSQPYNIQIGGAAVNDLSALKTTAVGAAASRALSDWLSNTGFNVPTVAALRAWPIAPLIDGAGTRTSGYAASGDQGSATYTWSAASTASDDGCSVIKPTVVSGAGRWLLTIPGSSLSVRQCGATGDGVTDDTPAFQKVAAYLGSRGGGTILYALRHAIKSSWTLPQGVSLQGPTLNADPGNPFDLYIKPGQPGFDTQPRAQYQAAMRTGPGLVLDPSVTISIGGRQAIDGVGFYSSNMKFDGTDRVANMAGTALFGQYVDSATIRKSTFVGFNLAIKFDEAARMRLEDIFLDTVNGIDWYRAYDIWDIDRVTAFNVTSDAPQLGDTSSLRPGTLVKLTGLQGGPRIKDLFGYGYHLGLDIQGPAAETIDGLWLDGPIDPNTSRPLDPGSVGLRILSASNDNAQIDDGSAANIKLTNPKFLSQGLGILVTPGNYGAISVLNPEFQHCDRYAEIGGLGFQMVNADMGPKSVAPGINFTNAQAANSARLTNGYIAGNENLLDFNNGGGKPSIIGYRRANGAPITQFNTGITPTPIVSGGSLALPCNDDICTVFVSGGGNIGNMGPQVPGARVTIVFKDATTTPTGGSSFYDDPSAGNFKTKGGFLATAGSSITFVYDPNLSKWSEIGRTLY